MLRRANKWHVEQNPGAAPCSCLACHCHKPLIRSVQPQKSNNKTHAFESQTTMQGIIYIETHKAIHTLKSTPGMVLRQCFISTWKERPSFLTNVFPCLPCNFAASRSGNHKQSSHHIAAPFQQASPYRMTKKGSNESNDLVIPPFLRQEI